MAELLTTPVTVLHVIACLFLMLVVLIQPGKSGGMGALSGAAAQQVFGGRGAGNFLTKTTWVTATIFFATSMTLAYFGSSIGDSLEDREASQAEVTLPPASPAEPATPEAPSNETPPTDSPTQDSPAGEAPASKSEQGESQPSGSPEDTQAPSGEAPPPPGGTAPSDNEAPTPN